MKLPKFFYFLVKSEEKGTKIVLENASDRDVVEVIRCRECRYWGGEYADNECSLITEMAVPKYWLKTQPEDYCSSGERRENEVADEEKENPAEGGEDS